MCPSTASILSQSRPLTNLAGPADSARRKRALGTGVRGPASSPGSAELLVARAPRRHPADSLAFASSPRLPQVLRSSGEERARGGGALRPPRAISRTDRLVSTGEPALRPAPTSHVRRGTPEGGAPSPDSRLTSSRGVSQDCLTKSKESSDRGAGGIGEGEPSPPPLPGRMTRLGSGCQTFPLSASPLQDAFTSLVRWVTVGSSHMAKVKQSSRSPGLWECARTHWPDALSMPPRL